MMTLERTLEQRREALQRANLIRGTRAITKGLVARGESPYHALLLRGRYDPLFATMKLREALEAMPGIGRIKAARLLTMAGISPSRTMGSLTAHQWDRLYAAMERWPAVRKRLSEARATVPVP
jgi:hypothetical protein